MTTMAKTLKINKMASNDEPNPTVSGTEGSIHINLDKEIRTGYEQGMKVFQGTYYRKVKLVEATELELAVAKEHSTAQENKIELLNYQLQVAVADSERWKRKYNGMLDRSYCPVDSSRNSSRKSVKIAPTPKKRSSGTTKSTPPKQDSGEKWLLPLGNTNSNTYS
jgi:hypothetical protein